ncbi:MAG: hypothetical protein HYU74_12685 [Dechloromonas sp.]|nr:hypothetical protein [Dechloromonas sp.]
MEIKHQKVSGVANPTDPAKVGGGHWDEAHAITGPRLYLSLALLRTGEQVFEYQLPDVTIVPSALGVDGIYDITFGASYNLTSANCKPRAFVLDIPVSGGFFAGAQVIANNVIRLKTYTGPWDVTYLTSAGVIWLDVFKQA